LDEIPSLTSVIKLVCQLAKRVEILEQENRQLKQNGCVSKTKQKAQIVEHIRDDTSCPAPVETFQEYIIAHCQVYNSAVSDLMIDKTTKQIVH